MQAVLDGISGGLLNVNDLISHRFPLADAAKAYDAVVNDNSVLGLTLEYPETSDVSSRVVSIQSPPAKPSPPVGEPTVGVIGAGNFTKLVLLPAIKAAGVPIKFVASGKGVTAKHAATKFEAEVATSDYRPLLADDGLSAVAITTRHNAHSGMVVEALEAGKHVFVEKPLAIDEAGLDAVRAAYANHPDRHLFVGFNRRFAPHTVALKQRLEQRAQPIAINCLVNAGDIPANTWIQDQAIGGGRIIGEGCHFIDLLLHLVGHPITTVQAVMFGRDAGAVPDDKMSINLAFADGSIGTVHYWANGPKSFPKERIEIFSEGRVAVIDNWRRIQAYNWKLPSMKLRQDKGHKAEVAAFFERLRSGGPPLIPFPELEQVTQATFAALRSAAEGITVHLHRSEEPI
jgi:predicted dehydrogenase